jgi:hypothetical protein
MFTNTTTLGEFSQQQSSPEAQRERERERERESSLLQRVFLAECRSTSLDPVVDEKDKEIERRKGKWMEKQNCSDHELVGPTLLHDAS